MNLRAWHLAVLASLLIGLAVSVGFNAYPLFQSPTIIGIADSKSVGHGTDNRNNAITWYTVSLALVTPDEKNGMKVGGTLAYIIEKQDFDRIQHGAVVKGRPGGKDDLRLEVLELTHSESFASGVEHHFQD